MKRVKETALAFQAAFAIAGIALGVAGHELCFAAIALSLLCWFFQLGIWLSE